MQASSCRTCGQRIYWIEDLGQWYHLSQIDMLICRSTVVEPADETAAV